MEASGPPRSEVEQTYIVCSLEKHYETEECQLVNSSVRPCSRCTKPCRVSASSTLKSDRGEGNVICELCYEAAVPTLSYMEPMVSDETLAEISKLFGREITREEAIKVIQWHILEIEKRAAK